VGKSRKIENGTKAPSIDRSPLAAQMIARVSAPRRICALLVLLAGAIAPAGAAASAVDVTSAHFSGVSANAALLQVDGCTTYFTSLTVWDGRWTRAGAGTSRLGMLFADLQTDDPCGSGWHQRLVTAPLAPDALSVRGDLGAATLRGTFPFSDRYDGPPTGSLDVDLSWAATGPFVRERSRSHAWSRLFGTFRLSALDYGSREAGVSGSLFDGTRDWAAGAMTIGTAGIFSTRLGTVALDR